MQLFESSWAVKVLYIRCTLPCDDLLFVGRIVDVLDLSLYATVLRGQRYKVTIRRLSMSLYRCAYEITLKRKLQDGERWMAKNDPTRPKKKITIYLEYNQRLESESSKISPNTARRKTFIEYKSHTVLIGTMSFVSRQTWRVSTDSIRSFVGYWNSRAFQRGPPMAINLEEKKYPRCVSARGYQTVGTRDRERQVISIEQYEYLKLKCRANRKPTSLHQ